MKSILPLISLLGMLVLVVAGTVWVVMTYPREKTQAAPREYNLSREQVQMLKKQVVLFVERKKYREAERLLRRIIELLPGNNKVVLMRGKVCFLRGDTLLAERIFRQVIMSSPDNAVARNNLGVLLASKGLYESGIRALLEAEKLSGGTSYILENLCQTFFISGRLAQAQRSWELARKNPSVPPEEALVLLAGRKTP